ncbi:hypothetical protein [Oryzobacter telluris]|jgi:hypothetical protein|uniref:hypothetical protein n=1 Tax=Oryzobacter telluris TaxID=3149179 RepID=UPI00370D8857
MAHYHSGLPPMDLEPFDPTPLWAATNSPRREKDLPTRAISRVAALRAGAALFITLGVAVAAFLLFA